MSETFRKMNAEEFARRLKMMTNHPDSRFAFFLGAGCSVSSGIPAAGSLVRNHWLPRLRDLRDPHRQDLDKWAAEGFPGYEPEKAAAFYGTVMEELFILPEERQREVEQLCEGKFPSFGYAVLASLMTQENGRFNVALTTNFDNLISDALSLFTQAHPLLVQHESLDNYARPTRQRPLIIKLHSDYYLPPTNTARSVDDLRADVEKRVRGIVRERGLVFMGYGGNDEGIARLLTLLTEEALPLGVYWVSESEPQGVIRPWLESRKAVWVQKGDFDEMMLLLQSSLNLPHPDTKRFEKIFNQYTQTYQALSNRIESQPDTAPGAASLKEAVRQIDQTFPDWWSVEMEAERLKHTDPTKADAVYIRGLERFPDSGPLLASYASFLRDFRKDNARAEEQYQRALAADDKNVELLMDYAYFLARNRKELDRAEDYYNKALQVDGRNARVMGTYASFLAKMRRDPKRAEEMYQKAMAIDAADPYIMVNYAGFLLAQGRESDGMEILNKVLPQSASDETPNLALESWFYLFSNGPAASRSQALADMKRALKAGRRRPGLLLTPNIVRARQTNHPDYPWLEKLVAIITDEASVSSLEDWPAWKAIQ